MNTHILVTIRPGCEAYARLVFDTIRIGFPSNNLIAWINGTRGAEIESHIASTGARIEILGGTIHHRWLQRVICQETSPFWICDTDVIFYDTVEDWKFKYAAIAGMYIPKFACEHTKCMTMSRLHTSLMYIDPHKLHSYYKEYLERFNTTRFNPSIDIINPIVIPQDGIPCFYDTMSLCYHAIRGEPFTDNQKDAYFHFHFGTFEDEVLAKHPRAERIKKTRDAILAHPPYGFGEWRRQEAYIKELNII